MQKKVLAFAAFLFVALSVSAQVGVNPADPFYARLEVWEARKIVRDLPPLRPYPAAVVRDILAEVMSSSDERAAAEARALHDRIFSRPVRAGVSADGRLRFSGDADSKQAVGLAGISGDASFLKAASASYKLNFAGTVNADAAVLPVFTALPFTFRDAADLGPLEMFLEMDGAFAYGSSGFYVQAGISHSSFGPFYGRGLVLDSDAQHTANLSVVLNPGRWSYTHGLFALGASDNSGNGLFPNKFLMLHSIDVRIFDWLSAAYYEAVVYGDRFDPSYLVPMPFMVAQGITGFDDNIIMGLSFRVKPFVGFEWATDIFIDDIALDDVFRLDFDTKIRGALQTGVRYAPPSVPVLEMVSLDYTLVTPYMYAHKQNVYDPLDGSFVVGGSSAINYQAYTNGGKPLGSQLAPNSDRIFLSATGRPVAGLGITVSGAFMRHANVNESLTLQEALRYLNAPKGHFLTDGSINNHPHIGYAGDDGKVRYEYMDSAKDRLMFMSQDTKMYVVQVGLDVSYDFPATRFGRFSVGLGYTFEYIRNWGVQSDMFPGEGRIEDDGKWISGGKTEADVAAAVSTWKANLKDVVNNYVTVSVKYVY